MKTIEKEFNNAVYQNFDSVQKSLTKLYHRVALASANNDYQNLLNANAWGKYYHKLTKEELFLMNLNDKEILAILNLSIYQSIIQKDYSHLLNGIFTYSRLRFLNRVYVSGTKNWIVVESLITNDTDLKNICYPKQLTSINKIDDAVVMLIENFLKTILVKSDFTHQVHKQYSEFIGEVSAKFDNALIKYLYGLTTNDYELCKTCFEQMEQLYSKCLWLTSGWYREANLSKKVPIFLLGLYQLKNFTAINFEPVIKNEFLKTANQFIVETPNYQPELFREFNGELKFLNEILTNNFVSFYVNFKAKMNEIKNSLS